ncbi:MAG: protein-tyrosine phosphatase [Alphaproteobacteria bacterium]|jgi:protein-tyrosine phosphatase
MIRILFVCMGNICRSPTAEGVFEAKVKEAGLDHLIEADSAGTSQYHIGNSPDPRAVAAAAQRGIDISHLISRRVEPEDFFDFNMVLAMDGANHTILSQMAGTAAREKLKMFLEFAPTYGADMPDPYYGGAEGFETVLDISEQAARGLLIYLVAHHGLASRKAE